MNNYPEAEKVASVKDKSQSIGLFLDWLLNNGNTLCQWHDITYWDEHGNRLSDNTIIWHSTEPAQYLPVRLDINSLLAEYFDIDLVKYEDEKRQMLEELKDDTKNYYFDGDI